MKTFWKKAFLFIKLFLLQSICFVAFMMIFSYYENVCPQSFLEILYDCIICFWHSMGIGGLLFTATSLTYIFFISKKAYIIIGSLIWILLYVFVFFEYVLDIGNAYDEVLLPLSIAVYGGFILAKVLKIYDGID